MNTKPIIPPASVMTCEKCGNPCWRKSPRQKWCSGCRGHIPKNYQVGTPARPPVTAARAARARPDRNSLVESHMGLAKRVAQKMYVKARGTVDYDDLLSGACMGLLNARDNFNPSKSKFITLAIRTVPGAMIDQMRSESERSRLSMSGDRAIESARSRFYAQHGRNPTDDELRAMGVTEQNIEHGRLAKRERSRAVDLVYRDTGSVDREDWWDAVCYGLTRNEKTIVLLHFRDGLTMKQVGRTIGCSESWVSQLIESLLARMRGSPRIARLMEMAHAA